jgi:hypothetical protein
MTETEELRREAEQAKKRLVDTVGELGDTVKQARDEAIKTAKRLAPLAAASALGLVMLRIRSHRRGRDA